MIKYVYLALVICFWACSPDLTWRDVQYITLMTARPEPMVDGQWVTNALGRQGENDFLKLKCKMFD